MSGVKERKFGAIDNIYKSVEKLQDSILNVTKTLLTEPSPQLGPIPGYDVLNPVVAWPKSFYFCITCHWLTRGNVCSNCHVDNKPGRPLAYLPPAYPKEGYLKKGVTYIVDNTLEIMPLSTINVMDVLSKMKVKKFSDLLSSNKRICRKDVSNLHTLNSD
jgi:hypothetical protein